MAIYFRVYRCYKCFKMKLFFSWPRLAAYPSCLMSHVLCLSLKMRICMHVIALAYPTYPKMSALCRVRNQNRMNPVLSPSIRCLLSCSMLVTYQATLKGSHANTNWRIFNPQSVLPPFIPIAVRNFNPNLLPSAGIPSFPLHA